MALSQAAKTAQPRAFTEQIFSSMHVSQFENWRVVKGWATELQRTRPIVGSSPFS
jgi:hypothetical protein